jgi:hypothetical protein
VRRVPHHWTRIGDASAAEPQDDVYVDEDTNAVFVLGKTTGNQKKSDIASKYGVPESNVTLLNKK